MNTQPKGPIRQEWPGFSRFRRTALLGATVLVLGSCLTQAQPARDPQLGRPGAVHSRQPTNAPVTRPKEFFRGPWGEPRQPGQLHVKFRPGTTAAQRQAAHQAAGMIRVENPFGDILPDTVSVTIPAGRERSAANSYLDDPNVVYAEPVYLARTAAIVPNDPQWGLLWGMHRIRAEHAWDFAKFDPNFTVGVVDSGLFTSHLDLRSNVWVNLREIPGNRIDDDNNGKVDDINGWNFFGDFAAIDDTGGSHGTHVAGTIGAVGDNGNRVVGVTWRCKILMAACGQPGSNVLFNTAAGFRYVLQQGARVSNHSYGSTNYSQVFYDLLIVAQAMGHIAVCSAGNDSTDNDRLPVYPASYQVDNVISVAASSLSDELAIFSNYGASSVDLAAPGFSILSTVGVFPDGTAYMDGTSMAAPHVTGAIALLWSTYPDLTWWQIRDRILTGVTKSLGLAGKVASAGRLDVARAMAVVCKPGAGGGGTGVLNDPDRDFGNALATVPRHGLLYVQPPGQAWSWTGRISGSPKRIEALGGPVRLGSP